MALGLRVLRGRTGEAPSPVVAGAETREVDRQVRELSYERSRNGRGRYAIALLDAIQDATLIHLVAGASTLTVRASGGADLAAKAAERLTRPEPFEEVTITSAGSADFAIAAKPSSAPLSLPTPAALPAKIDHAEVLSQLQKLAKARALALEIEIRPSERDRWLLRAAISMRVTGAARAIVDLAGAIDASPTLMMVREVSVQISGASPVGFLQVFVYAHP